MTYTQTKKRKPIPCRFAAFVILMVASPFVFSQTFQYEKRDYIWLTGYSSNPDDLDFGGSIIDFHSVPPSVSYEYREMDFDLTSTGICDPNGNLLFYFNGYYIANQTLDTMENGGGLNPDFSLPQDRLAQGGLALPFPGFDNVYYLLHEPATFVGNMDGNIAGVFTLYYSLINMNLNNGEGTVMQKNYPFIQDTLDYGGIQATRHANGRDWWIIVAEYNSNRYYTILLSPLGLVNYEIQQIGLDVPSGLGQAVFSPDGSRYARVEFIDVQTGTFLDFYDFDRCSGLLSNHTRIHILGGWLGGGVAFSPNSRFLYFSNIDHVFQYDLEAADIASTKDTVAVWDGFVDGLPIRFYFPQLGPDLKIYIAASFTSPYMHIIHSPDLEGEACNVEQRGLQLPTHNRRTVPNFPNFRLGPLDGSPCDTLGIDMPVSVATSPKPEFKVAVFPNPTSRVFNLRVSDVLIQSSTFELYDALGQMVYRESLQSGTTAYQLILPELPSGIYFWSLGSEGGGLRSGKVVVE